MKRPLLVLFLLTIAIAMYPQQKAAIDSLEAILPGAAGAERSQILMRLAGLYQSVSIEQSLAYDLENAALQDSLGQVKNLSGTFNNIGVSYYMKGDYGKALDYFEQSLRLREQLNDTMNAVKTLNNLGVISQIAGDYEKALDYLNRSLIFKLDLNDTLSIAKTLNNIGVIYKDVNDLADAHKFLNQALDYYRAMDNFPGIAAAYNNIGQVFEARKISDSALIYYQKSLEIKRQIDDQRGIGNTLNNLAKIYHSKGEDEKALAHFIEAIQVRDSIGDLHGLASTLNNMGNLYVDEKKYSEAEVNFNRSNAIAEKENLIGIQQRNYAGLARLYELAGDNVRALAFYKQYSTLRDTVFNQDLKQQIADVKVQYETEKSRRENQLLRQQLQQQKEIQQLRLSNSKKERIQLTIIIIALFFAGIIIVLYLQYHNSRKLKNQLKLHNTQLESRVKERTLDLEEANAAKDRFFSIIAHDLKSPFSGLLGFTEILFNDFDELSDSNKKEFAGIIKTVASDIYNLLENLLEWASLQTGRINLTPEKLDLGNMISKTVSVHQLMLSEKKIELNRHINTLDYAYADKDTLNVVLRNLISNAIKFTPKGGRIDVSVDRQSGDSGQGELIVKVKDTGIGIAGSDLENLFNLNKKKRTAGTEKETGTGLGLVLCKEFVEKNGGRLFVESKPGEGSTFGFTVPAA